MGNTPTHTESADDRYLYGTKKEVEERLENGYGPTESHFTQIPPATSGPRGVNINEQGGTTRNNRATIRHRAKGGG